MAKFPSWIKTHSIETEGNTTVIVFSIRWWHPKAWFAVWREIVAIANEAGYPAWHPYVWWGFIRLILQLNLMRKNR